MLRITPRDLLHGYSIGIFPMAGGRDDPEIFWFDPRQRGILPLDGFHISRSLARRMRRGGFEVTINRDFDGVVKACADRPETWINAEIHALYTALHKMGHAHSLEVYADSTLIGGVYGVAMGAAFFGESMFSTRTDASKIALAYLVDRLNIAGFALFDVQFQTDHLATLGAIEVSRSTYQAKLRNAIQKGCDFTAPGVPTAQDVIQRMTQMS